MPHQCVKCGKLYLEESLEVTEGCLCEGKVFFWIKSERMNGSESPFILTTAEREEMEEDIKDIVGEKNDQPVVLDMESVNVTSPGKYEIDLVNLFKKNHPVIIRVADGKYLIDLPSTMQKMGKGKIMTKKAKK